MSGLLSAYLGRRAAGRTALRLSRPAVARLADLAGFLADFLAATFADVFFADVFTTFLADFAAALRFPSLPLSRFAIADPSSAGERTVVIPAASSAANFAAAVPLPPATP